MKQRPKTSVVNVSFRIIDIREVHPNKTAPNTLITVNPIFREIKQITTEAEVVAMVLSILEDTVMVGPTIRVIAHYLKKVIKNVRVTIF